MGQVNNATKVDFAAYCRAFSLMDSSSSICGRLDPTEGTSSVDFLYRESTGDGGVRVPEYGVDKGRATIVGSRWLSEAGEIIRTRGGNSWTLANRDPDRAKYFIAGAFGEGELTDASGLDDAIVDGLRQLYPLCLKDAESCVDSAPAKMVASAWQGIVDAREGERRAQERTKVLKSSVERLQGEYDELAMKVVDKQSLIVGVAPYKSRMPASPSTSKDFELAEHLLKEMMVVVQAVIDGDGKRAEEKDKRARLATYRAENPGMRSRINKAEGIWFYHFTGAYDAALECMPTPRNAEEEYCVEKNKYEMGQNLEQLAYAHPARSECVKSERRCHDHHVKGEGTVEECDDWCVQSRDYGHTTSKETALSVAKAYCSTTCK